MIYQLRSLRTFLTLSIAWAGFQADAVEKTNWKFSFGGQAQPDWTQVLSSNTYTSAIGYGFEPGANMSSVSSPASALNGATPFYFSVKLPEGNYKVSALLAAGAIGTIKSESRRLMVEHAQANDAKSATRTFIVNVKTPVISSSNKVHLKTRELTSEIWNWDEKLTLEFNGTKPGISKLMIEKVDVPTVFLLGDSTVCDQPAEPWNSWGQMLPRFFKPDVAISNHAESGETLANSLRAQRFEKVFSHMKKGDYLFIQFGHNDQKDKSPTALDSYKKNLKSVVARTRSLGGTPVLVTSMERKSGLDHDTLAGYPDTVIAVSKEEKCALIDLHATSRVLYRALGADMGKAFQDGTHHNNYGSYELAKCVVEGIRQANLPLAKSIVDDVVPFNPAKPDPVASFDMPASPVNSSEKPLGN